MGNWIISWGVKATVPRADNLTTFICRLSWNSGASTSWNPQGCTGTALHPLHVMMPTRIIFYLLFSYSKFCGKLPTISIAAAEVYFQNFVLLYSYYTQYRKSSWILGSLLQSRSKYYSKINPTTGLDRPWGCQKVEDPKLQDDRHMKVVRLSALGTGRRLYTQEIFLVHIFVRDWVDSRTIVRPEGFMSMKNSNDSIRNRIRDLPSSSAVPQPTALPRTPQILQ
jgi:hypothetical protein